MNKLIEISKLFEISLDELVNDIETPNSETTYKESPTEKNNRKIAFKIFIVGLLISCVIGAVGWMKQKEAIKTNEQAYNDAIASSQNMVENAEKRLSEIDQEMNNLSEQIKNMEDEIASMEKEYHKIVYVDGDLNSTRANDLLIETQTKRSNLSDLNVKYNDLDQEAYEIQNKDYTAYYDLVEPIKYMIFYYIAAGVAGLTVLISLIYFLVTRKK